MFSAALYARVRFLLVQFAHETAGAARIRHSLLPLRRENDWQTSGAMRRENAKLYPCRPGEGRDPYAAALVVEKGR